MATSNHERIGRTLDLLKDGLRPFVEREYEARFGPNWRATAVQVLSREREIRIQEGHAHLDITALIQLMWFQWNEVFAGTLGPAERSLVGELRDVRNRWAHQHSFSTDDTYRAMDTAHRLLTVVSAAEQAGEVDRQRQEVVRQMFVEQNRTDGRPLQRTEENGGPEAVFQEAVMAELKARMKPRHSSTSHWEYIEPFGLDVGVFQWTRGITRIKLLEFKVFTGSSQRCGFGNGRGFGPQVDLLLFRDDHIATLDACSRWCFQDLSLNRRESKEEWPFALLTASQARAATAKDSANPFAPHGVRRGSRQHNFTYSRVFGAVTWRTWDGLLGDLEDFLLSDAPAGLVVSS